MAGTDTRTLDDTVVGTFKLGDRSVRRLGFGAMRISGARNAEGVRDRETAVRLTRRVVERGVNLIDTANIYGYGQSEEIIAEALHPYPDDLLVATRAGFRPGEIAPVSSVILPIPGTSSITHLDENVDAAWVDLTDDEVRALDAAVGGR